MDIKSIGKVGLTIEGDWDITKYYERLSLVGGGKSNFTGAYISKIDVPPGIQLSDKRYWQRLYIDFNIHFSQEFGDDPTIGISQRKLTIEFNKVFASLDSINQQISVIKSDIANIKLDVSRLKSRMDKAETDIENIENSVTDLTLRVDSDKKDVTLIMKILNDISQWDYIR